MSSSDTGTRPPAGLPALREGQRAPSDLVARRALFAPTEVAPGLPVHWSELDVAGIPCLRVVGGDRLTVLHLHGGGFRMGSPRAYLAYAARLAASAGVTVVLPQYRLAPEHPFPAGLHDALAVHHDLAGTLTERVVLAGDSAGAALAAAVTAAAVASDGPAPAALMLLSPWLDLRCTSAFYSTSSDAHFDAATAASARSDYLQGHPADDPWASPLLIEHRGFPPTLIQVGAREALVDDALGLARSLAAADVSCTVEVVAGQTHTWPLVQPSSYASVAALESCSRFLRTV